MISQKSLWFQSTVNWAYPGNKSSCLVCVSLEPAQAASPSSTKSRNCRTRKLRTHLVSMLFAMRSRRMPWGCGTTPGRQVCASEMSSLDNTYFCWTKFTVLSKYYLLAGFDEHGETVPNSMYQELWNNTPKEANTEFPDYTWYDHFQEAVPSYLPRADVKKYLEGKQKTYMNIWIWVLYAYHSIPYTIVFSS